MIQEHDAQTCPRCHPNERQWRGHWVDMNLEDAWLDALNSLAAFNLVSICEGHANKNRFAGRDSPHVVLRVKDPFLPCAVRTFDDHVSAIRSLISREFDSRHNKVVVEFGVRLYLSREREALDHDLTVSIRATHQRTSAALDDDSRRWFTSSVNRVQTLDDDFAKMFSVG